MERGSRDRRLTQAAAARRVVAELDDDALERLLSDGRGGWGRSAQVVVDGCPLFVKAVPVTERELDDGLTTTNR